MNRYYTMPEVVKAIGVQYQRVRYAVMSGIVKPAKQWNGYRLFTDKQVETLKAHFASKQANDIGNDVGNDAKGAT